MNETGRMELKYCECCGGLLLRRVGMGAVYCTRCRQQLEKLARPRPERTDAKPPARAAGRRQGPAARVLNIEAGTWSAVLAVSSAAGAEISAEVAP